MALVATMLVGALYVLVAIAVSPGLTVDLTAQVDARLERAIAFEMAADTFSCVRPATRRNDSGQPPLPETGPGGFPFGARARHLADRRPTVP